MKGVGFDPGGDVERMQKAITDQGVTVEKFLLTHGHLDHAGGTAELSEGLDLAIEGPHEDIYFGSTAWTNILRGLDSKARVPLYQPIGRRMVTR